ncbi:MAG: tetratricopeptide repeat protein, partial [Planctomycetia bacterium]|nr:tetratricopeptide repeat protein [Planctomycetia bacterium]
MDRLGTVLLTLVALGQVARAQEPGETVVVVRETSMKREKEVVQTLAPGRFARVEDVDSTWLWVSAENAGWIARHDVATPKEAIEIFTARIDEGADDALTYTALGNAKLADKQIDEAITDFNEALRRDPKLIVALTSRAHALAEQRHFEKALADLNQAAQLDPQSVDVLFLRGTLLAERGQFEKAAAD